MADGGAVDSYVWEYLKSFRPEVTARTRVIHRSPTFGFPPLVFTTVTDPEVVQQMKLALLEMSERPAGRAFLDGLELDGFGKFSPDLFDGIRRMANDTRKALLWLASSEQSAPK